MIEHTIEIAASPAGLFRLTQDYGRRLEWDPFLKSAGLISGAETAGLGVRAVCVSRYGLAMETEYVSFNPPRVTAVRMTRGPLIIECFAGSWHFEEIEHGTTRVRFNYDFRARPRILSWLLKPILTWVFSRDTRKRLLALKAAVENRGLLA